MITSGRVEEPGETPTPAPAGAGAAGAPWTRRLLPHAACAATTLLFFAADAVLPRGATAAIGYCLAAVLARMTRQRRFLLAVTGVCTALTWIGLALEPAGEPQWISVFERAMVSGVLWLTLALVWRQMAADAALAQRTQDLQDAVRELNRSNAELENFASVVSHDVRGPLNSIGLVIQLIASRPVVRLDAECRAWADSAMAEVARMNGMVEKLLKYGRAGARGLELSDCDCGAVLGVVRRALRAELEAAGARVTNDPLPVVRADPVLLAELLQNLIENGIKYRGPDAPVVHVSAAPVPEGWRFAVRDNGVGVRPEDCGRLFEPFHRGTGVQPSSPGAGLGLATCRRIVERHGGRIGVQPGPGPGSTFTFVIPRQPPATAATVAAAAAGRAP